MRQCGAWRQAGLDLPVAVNLSTRNLKDGSLVGAVGDLLADHRVPPDRLTLEITESAIMDDPIGALVMLTRLANMGIRLEIDDFGTGYSSLGYLKRLPVGGLKVDRAFVQQLTEDANDAAIVASTVGLAQGRGPYPPPSPSGPHSVGRGPTPQAGRKTTRWCGVASRPAWYPAGNIDPAHAPQH